MGGPSEAISAAMPSKLENNGAAHHANTRADSEGPSEGVSDDLERGFVPPVLNAPGASKASNANRCAPPEASYPSHSNLQP